MSQHSGRSGNHRTSVQLDRLTKIRAEIIQNTWLLRSGLALLVPCCSSAILTPLEGTVLIGSGDDNMLGNAQTSMACKLPASSLSAQAQPAGTHSTEVMRINPTP